MTYVTTLVSSPKKPMLDDSLLRQVARNLPAAQPAQWLDKGFAADILFTPRSAVEILSLQKIVLQILDGIAIDVFTQPVVARRKKLLVADMDSTMIAQECIDELADFVGQKTRVAAITERAMRGEIAFEPALRERVALLRDLDTDIIRQVIAERISLTPGARMLVQTMRAQGAYTALVSGGFTSFTSEIATMIGFHTHQANVLIIENGKFSGHVAEPILGKAAKLEALKHFRTLHSLSAEETLAIGDGANDLAMLEQAGLGVAFHAKPAVAAAAHARIDHGDLTALLYAQGYKRQEFLQ